MGIDPLNFADSLLGILAQRLARTLCRNCKQAYTPDKEEYDYLAFTYGEEQFAKLNIPYSKDLKFYQPGGCNDCNQTGYRGRVGIHELLVATDNIKRLIDKAAGALEGSNYEEIAYEGYWPGGVAVIAQIMTDNRNRTAPEIRHIFDRAGGTLGAANCVGWMFDRKGVIVVEELGKLSEDDVMMAALDAGAEDMSGEDGIYEIVTAPSDITVVHEALEKAGVKVSSSEVMLIPQNTVAVEGENAEKLVKFIETLEEHDDVQNVYHNAEIPEEYM
jgi:YebC/PmpR family DNA-binding regulatory protein